MARRSAVSFRSILRRRRRGVTFGDIAPPVLSGNSFNDTDDAATFSTTEGGTFVWATHLTTETLTANGSGGWTGNLLESGTDTVASSGESTISAAYTATTGTGGESRKFSYYVRDAAGNDSNVITETFTVNSSYTENYVDNNGTAWLAYADGQMADSSILEFVCRYKPQSAATQSRFWESWNDKISILQYIGNKLRVIAKDTTNTIIFQFTSTNAEFVDGTEYLVYVGLNSSTGTYVVQINGSNVAGTPAVSTTGAAFDLSEEGGLLATEIGGGILDAHVSEIFVGTGTTAGGAAFWNGGLKDNLATLAGYTPQIYFGNGQAATAWDAATNLGSITVTAGATGFTEA